MQMERSVINRARMRKEKDDGYIDADRGALIAMVWDITKDAWAFVGTSNVEQRLQRDVGKFIRRKC